MPLFAVNKHDLSSVAQTNFDAEKQLQALVERNLQTVFNCRLVASEFPTGAQHAGRIDTLALSEDDNPVIIEYKKVESSELINQSLFYLSWIRDHRGDFEIAAQRALGVEIRVDWSDVRVICIAPNYKKYDLHAVQVMGANIELWTYRLFKNECLYLEEVFQKSYAATDSGADGTRELTAGQKAAITRKTGSYSFEQHLEGKSDRVQELARLIQEYMLNLDTAMEEAPKKFYVAYRISQNIACMEVQQHKVLLFLKLDAKEFLEPRRLVRDVSGVGHYGTGDLEVTLRGSEDFEAAKPLIEAAYHKVGG